MFPLSFDDAKIRKIFELASVFRENFQLFFKIFVRNCFTISYENKSGKFFWNGIDPALRCSTSRDLDRSHWDPRKCPEGTMVPRRTWSATGSSSCLHWIDPIGICSGPEGGCMLGVCLVTAKKEKATDPVGSIATNSMSKSCIKYGSRMCRWGFLAAGRRWLP